MYTITFGASPHGAANEIHKCQGQIEFCLIDGVLTVVFGGAAEMRYEFNNCLWSQPNSRTGYADILIGIADANEQLTNEGKI